MKLKVGQGLSASAAALAVGLALLGVARAQEDTPPINAGLITGEVARCVNGAEAPAANVSVGVDGGSTRLGLTTTDGGFFIALPAGQYTVIATADDGTTASRQYVPVITGEVLDIGILDLGGGVSGCGPDSDATQPVLPTFTPTAVATAVPPTPTATAVPPPTATPVPAEMAPADVAPPGEVPPGDMPPADIPPADMPPAETPLEPGA